MTKYALKTVDHGDKRPVNHYFAGINREGNILIDPSQRNAVRWFDVSKADALAGIFGCQVIRLVPARPKAAPATVPPPVDMEPPRVGDLVTIAWSSTIHVPFVVVKIECDKVYGDCFKKRYSPTSNYVHINNIRVLERGPLKPQVGDTVEYTAPWLGVQVRRAVVTRIEKEPDAKWGDMVWGCWSNLDGSAEFEGFNRNKDGSIRVVARPAPLTEKAAA